jgi:hypothetical protein
MAKREGRDSARFTRADRSSLWSMLREQARERHGKAPNHPAKFRESFLDTVERIARGSYARACELLTDGDVRRVDRKVARGIGGAR